jgi:tagatose 6-phosphate kinase
VILAVTLNASIDKTMVVPHLSLNGRRYADEVLSIPGGKGINVARVLHTLAAPVTVLGFGAGHNGQFVTEQLELEGIPCELVPVPGESRMCLTLVDMLEHTHTEINERGPEVPAHSLQAWHESYRRWLPRARAVILSGSVPPGVPDSVYRTCIEEARAARLPVALDAKNDALRLGMEAGPDLIKPNREELSDLVGEPLPTMDDVLRVAPRLGPALISLGEEGAILSTPSVCLHGWLKRGTIVSPVGSGDSLLAAFMWGRLQGRPEEECLRLGVAAGLANAWHLGAGSCRWEEIFNLAAQVQVRELVLRSAAG